MDASISPAPARLFSLPPSPSLLRQVYGKYLDLTSSHLEALNIPGVFSSSSGPNLSYDAFLHALLSASASADSNVSLALPGGAAAKVKSRKKYVKWLRGLRAYLRGFLARTMPLLDATEEVERGKREELEERWAGVEAARWGSDDVAKGGGAQGATTTTTAARPSTSTPSTTPRPSRKSLGRTDSRRNSPRGG